MIGRYSFLGINNNNRLPIFARIFFKFKFCFLKFKFCTGRRNCAIILFRQSKRGCFDLKYWYIYQSYHTHRTFNLGTNMFFNTLRKIGLLRSLQTKCDKICSQEKNLSCKYLMTLSVVGSSYTFN